MISELPGGAVVCPSPAASLVNSFVIVTKLLASVLSKNVYNLVLGLNPSPVNLICCALIKGRTPLVITLAPLLILSILAIARVVGASP